MVIPSMYQYKLNFFIILWTFFLFGCGGKGADVEVSPDETLEKKSFTDVTNVERNIDEVIEDLHMEFKKLKDI